MRQFLREMSHMTEMSDMSPTPQPLSTTSLLTGTNFFVDSGIFRNDGGSDAMILEPTESGRRTARRQSRKKCRLVNKDGTSNVRHAGIINRWRQFMADLMTTLVELPFYSHILMFVMTFFLSWLGFACIWFTIPVGYGDIHHDIDSDRKMCIQRVNDFATALLFSIETQSTIGYGSRVIEPECPVTLLVLMIQLMVGVFLECFAVGLIYSKLSRTSGRLSAVRYSSNAVICQRNGQYCLAFRIWNVRHSQILTPKIRAVLIRYYFPGKSSLLISDVRNNLKLETEGGDRGKFFLFSWPSIVIHKIDASSPLWEMSSFDLLQQKFEIIVTMEGTIESTGSTARFMTSYLSSEVLWGHKLTPLYPLKNGKKSDMLMDCSRFDDTENVTLTPQCSAKVWAQQSIERTE